MLDRGLFLHDHFVIFFHFAMGVSQLQTLISRSFLNQIQKLKKGNLRKIKLFLTRLFPAFLLHSFGSQGALNIHKPFFGKMLHRLFGCVFASLHKGVSVRMFVRLSICPSICPSVRPLAIQKYRKKNIAWKTIVVMSWSILDASYCLPELVCPIRPNVMPRVPTKH